MEQIKENRNISIDIARGIAIILVVWGHSGFIPIEKVVNLIHLPTFFFISGFLFSKNQKKNLKCFAIKAFKRLYIPYIIAEMLAIIFRNFLFYIGVYSEFEPYGGQIIHPFLTVEDGILEMLKSVFLFGREPIIGSVWFLVTLLILEFLYYFMHLIFKKWFDDNVYKMEILFAFFLWVAGLVSEEYFYIGRITPVLHYWIFFSIGNINGLRQNQKEAVVNKIVLIVIFAFAMIFKLLQLTVFGPITSLVFLGGSVSAIGLVMDLSKKLENCTFFSGYLSYMGRNSLYIMIIHFLGFKIVSGLLVCFGVVDYSQLAQEAAGNNTFILSIIYLIGALFFSKLFLKFRKEVYILIKSKENVINKGEIR